jgi:hypothetical protein
MNTAQQSLYDKVTLTFPRETLIRLQVVPKGKRSAFVVNAVEDQLKLEGLKNMAKRLSTRGRPSTIREYKGNWRKRLTW